MFLNVLTVGVVNTTHFGGECLVLIVFAMNALHVFSTYIGMPKVFLFNLHACSHEISRLALLRPSLHAAMASPQQTLPSMRMSEDEINEWNAFLERDIKFTAAREEIIWNG